MPPEVFVVKDDCRLFRGHIPCAPNKREGVHCADCPHYDKIEEQILIIKLGATGDVIRTTPLLHKLAQEHPRAKIWWLTESPAIVPKSVDVVLPMNLQSILMLEAVQFDIVYNLDKDFHACALASRLQTRVIKGFTLKNNAVAPADADAVEKFTTGIFDDVSKRNTKSYPVELFEVCGYTFKNERYILDSFPSEARDWNIDHSKYIIGLNTGCGDRWTSRQWADEQWIMLAQQLQFLGCEVILLGGGYEHERNLMLAERSAAKYFGHFPLPAFVNLVSHCDMVVTLVTMALHVAIGLEKKVVVINNIFNRREFDLYGLGEIVEPEKECTCYFQQRCINTEYRCMEHLPVSRVLDACMRWKY